MNFFHQPEQVWLIQRACMGRYMNSPRIWRDCGCARARSREVALRRAEEIVGVGKVRVRLLPVEGAR